MTELDIRRCPLYPVQPAGQIDPVQRPISRSLRL